MKILQPISVRSNWKMILLTIVLVTLLVLFSNFRKPSWIRNITKQLPKHPTKKYQQRAMEQINEIVIHHTAGSTSATPESIAAYHVGPNHISEEGIPGIAYHFMIASAGQVYQTNDLTSISWHAKNYNSKTIGICLIGNFNEAPPTKSQQTNLVRLIKHLNRQLGKDLSISGHKEVAGPGYTTCPGHQFDISNIEQSVYG